MQIINQSYRSMRLVLDLNWDWALYLAKIAAAIWGRQRNWRRFTITNTDHMTIFRWLSDRFDIIL